MAEPILGVLPRVARRQGVGSMPHRTASCSLAKLAILSGKSRLAFAQPQAAARTAAGMITAGKR